MPKWGQHVCGGTFHRSCLHTWVRMSTYQGLATCPNCRQPIVVRCLIKPPYSGAKIWAALRTYWRIRWVAVYWQKLADKHARLDVAPTEPDRTVDTPTTQEGLGPTPPHEPIPVACAALGMTDEQWRFIQRHSKNIIRRLRAVNQEDADDCKFVSLTIEQIAERMKASTPHQGVKRPRGRPPLAPDGRVMVWDDVIGEYTCAGRPKRYNRSPNTAYEEEQWVQLAKRISMRDK